MSEPRARLHRRRHLRASDWRCGWSGCSSGCRRSTTRTKSRSWRGRWRFAKGTLNPHNFLYPTFYFYVLFAWVGAYLAFVLADRAASPRWRRSSSCTSPIPTGIYTAGRALGVAAGTATIAVAVPARHDASAAGGPASPRRSSWRSRRCTFATRTTSSTTFRRRWPIVVAYLAMTRIWPGRRDASGPTDRRRRRCDVARRRCHRHRVLDALLLHLPRAAARRGRSCCGARARRQARCASAAGDRRRSPARSCSSRSRRSCSSSR